MNQDVTTNIYNRMLNSINNKIDNTTIKKIDIVKSTTLDGNILWTQLLLHDGGVLPIKIDILTKLSKIPTKAIYLLPGTGLNVESNFIIPTSNSIATFLASKYYLVIGITPREDSAPPDFNVELMKDWGLHKHTDDVNKVIGRLQKNIDTFNSKKSRGYNLSISVGIAYYDPENPCSLEELLARADKSMYDQKIIKKYF